MVATLDQVKDYIGEDGTANDAALADLLSSAETLVTQYVGSATVPADVLDQAIVMVAADLWNRRSAPNGVVNSPFANFGGDQGAVVRLARDPMQGVYPLLRRWVTPW